jgi:hypothetical protein
VSLSDILDLSHVLDLSHISRSLKEKIPKPIFFQVRMKKGLSMLDAWSATEGVIIQIYFPKTKKYPFACGTASMQRLDLQLKKY